MPTRRSLLELGTAGLASLAGCQGSLGTNPRRRVHLRDTASVPASAGVDIEIEQHGELITAERTVGFTVTTTNRERPKRLSVAAGPDCCLFAGERGGSRPATLWLYHVDDQPAARKDGRWTADRPREQPRQFEDVDCPRPRYAPGESVSNEYRLWADYRTRGYLAPSPYRFQTRVVVATVDGERVTSFQWGFDVVIERAPE